MAETWCKAFGRYLRTLRQRRGLSLQEVCSLSQAFAELVDKGYLSRCENGKQGPAFAKIIPLSRIYEVPADVLLERLELDMELDRVGGPDTEGLTFSELTSQASVAIDEGFFWKSYALLRDAVPRSMIDPVNSTLRSRKEQVACAEMNCATAARPLGRRRFALHEFKVLEALDVFGARLQVTLYERLSQTYLNTGDSDRATEYAVSAIETAEVANEPRGLGIAYSGRALVAYSESDLGNAAVFFNKAYKAFRRAGWRHACARVLNNLAQIHFDLGRIRASRRVLVSAEKLATELDQPRARALSRILMGEIDQLEHRQESAAKRWREAAEIAKTLDDKMLRFKAEYFLFRQATDGGNEATARSLRRRLNKLAHWVPEDTPELEDFRRLQRRTA